MSRLARFFWVLFVPLTVMAARLVNPTPAVTNALEVVNKVFAQFSMLNIVLPLSDQPVHTSVRPLCAAAIKPVQDNFSIKQQDRIDAVLHALDSLIDARDRLAKALGIEEKWWWPTGIDRLKVDAVLTQDVLTGRTENPNEMNSSSPKLVDKDLEITIQEDYIEHGQDRVLGQGHRASTVTFIVQKNSWVIDEIKTTTTDAYGHTKTETLSERLRKAVKSFDVARHSIERLPKGVEIRRGIKADN